MRVYRCYTGKMESVKIMANYDEKTGMAYGVISPHAISFEALNDIYDQGTDPYYENAKEEFSTDLKTVLDRYGFSIGQIDEVLSPALDIFNESFESSCGDGQCDYSDKDYILHVSGDNFGIFVIKSPYYTYCRKCSPCAPGAGDLNNPIDLTIEGSINEYTSEVKAYCLDKSFFDEEYSKIPYRVFRVEDDQEVI
jgi:hypothetical protein